MEALEKDKIEEVYQKETELYTDLDKGIYDMEHGRIVSHDDAEEQYERALEFYQVIKEYLIAESLAKHKFLRREKP